jgi:hypothetical protein
MKPKFNVIRFRRIKFDEKWKLAGTANQIFTYLSLKTGAIVQVVYEAPTGELFTITIVVAPEQKVFVHRDVIHVNGICKGIDKGDSIKCD